MKNTLATFIVIVIAVITLHAFRAMKQSTITGNVAPIDGVNFIQAVNGSDTTNIRPGNGSFTLTTKPGSYKMLINARSPFKNTVVDVHVQEGQTAGLGTITLQN